jgi:hypothetical protein
MLQQAVIRSGGRVMELIDHDHVECIRGDPLQLYFAQRLDHRKHMSALSDPPTAMLLTEGTVAQNRSIRRKRLVQNLLAVRDEQQREIPT